MHACVEFVCVHLRACLHTCASACLPVREHACARASLCLYACVGVCMCVCICVRAEVRTCRRVCVRVRARTVCVNVCTCMYLYTRTCVCLCVHLCTQVCVHVCAFVQGCVHAHMRKGRMCVCRFCSCIISALETLSVVGFHALLILKLRCSWCCLLSNHWLLLNYARDSLPLGKRLLNSLNC